jgi:hypothetical protein
MTQRDPSAAAALYPHLKRQVPEPRQQQRTGTSLAVSMFPNLPSSAPPKPQPSVILPPLGRITFGYEVVPGLRRKER